MTVDINLSRILLLGQFARLTAKPQSKALIVQ